MPPSGCAFMIYLMYGPGLCSRSLYRDILAWRLNHSLRWGLGGQRVFHDNRDDVGKDRRTARTLPCRWDRKGTPAAASPRRWVRCCRLFVPVRHRTFSSPSPCTRFRLARIRRERQAEPPVRSRLLRTIPLAPIGLFRDSARGPCRYLYGRGSGALLRTVFAGAR